MRKKSCVIAVGLLLLTVVCVLLYTIGERPKCSVEFLVLTEDKVSGGWRDDLGFLPPALDPLGAQEAFLMTMQNDDNEGISHTVYRYHSSWLATFHFWFDRAVFFPSASTDWSALEQADDLPLQADQQRIQCGTGNEPYLSDRCVAVLRYGSYISDFGMDFSMSLSDEESTSVEEFLEIVLRIDELFGSCGE